MPQASMRRHVSTTALLFASVSAILGSGWLFAAYYASRIAGPAAIISWLIGGALIITIAFVFAELAAMIPIAGSSVRIPQFTHGTLASFIFAWLTWLAWVSLVPTEVQAVIQYISYFVPNLVNANSALTHYGYLIATSLMLIISIVNIYSMRWLIRGNNFLTILKISIPLLLAGIILWHTGWHLPRVTPQQHHFHPYGLHGIFAAIATGGILFTFNGFKQACEMAGEAQNPSRSLPIAIVGSVAICLMIYLSLQVSFIAAILPKNLIPGGWQQLQLQHSQSPLAAVMQQIHLTDLMPILYIGAIIGPLAAAFLNMLSASRSLYGTSKNGYIPYFLQKLNSKGHPVYAILVCFAAGMLLFAPLPGWHAMISFLTSIMAITYAVAPICVLTLRHQAPQLVRPFKLPCVYIWAPVAFYLCNLLTYWSGWDVISKLGIALIIGLVLLLLCRHWQKPAVRQAFHWRASIWIWPYFIGLSLISYLGNYGHGTALLKHGWDYILLAALSLIVIFLATRCALPAQQTIKWIQALKTNQNEMG